MVLHCGGGINNSRCHVNCLSKSLPHFCGRVSKGHRSCHYTSPVAHPKFSVTASAYGTCRDAEVRITKTTDLNVRKGQEFDTLMQELQQVRASLTYMHGVAELECGNAPDPAHTPGVEKSWAKQTRWFGIAE